MLLMLLAADALAVSGLFFFARYHKRNAARKALCLSIGFTLMTISSLLLESTGYFAVAIAAIGLVFIIVAAYFAQSIYKLPVFRQLFDLLDKFMAQAK